MVVIGSFCRGLMLITSNPTATCIKIDFLSTTYKYGKAKVNIKGRGNLGFGWIEKKDLQSNKLKQAFVVVGKAGGAGDIGRVRGFVSDSGFG
jgi:hypothetical protein